MNLWKLFPNELLEIEGILSLPFLILPSYLVCFVIFFRLNDRQKERTMFVSFLLLSVLASTVMWLTLGPRIGQIIPPLLLLSNIALPLIVLNLGLMKAGSHSLFLWGFSSLAGSIHAISWSVWLMALARS